MIRWRSSKGGAIRQVPAQENEYVLKKQVEHVQPT